MFDGGIIKKKCFGWKRNLLYEHGIWRDGELMFDGEVTKEKCLWWKEILIWRVLYPSLPVLIYLLCGSTVDIIFEQGKTGKLLTFWAFSVWICVSYEIINFWWLFCLKKLNYYASLHWCCTTSQNFDSGSPCRQPDASRPLRFQTLWSVKIVWPFKSFSTGWFWHALPCFLYQTNLHLTRSFLTWRISWTRSSSWP